MKYVLVLTLAAAALAVCAAAQEATPKPPRKFLMFLPGSRKPEPTPEPLPVPKALPVLKTTPKPAPKPTARSAPKVVAKATPKAQPPAEPKAEMPPEPKPEDKLRSNTVEAMSPLPATPPPKPAAPLRDVSAKAPATPPAVKPPQGPAANGAAATAALAVATGLENPAAPAVITSTVPPEPAQIVRGFFGLLGKRDIEGAYTDLMKGSKIGERPGEVLLLKAKTKDAIELFGAIHGYDLVEIKSVGDRLMRATYLSLGHELPLRWRFYFYKAEADWKLIDLRVDDRLTGIFDEATEEVPRNSEVRP